MELTFAQKQQLFENGYVKVPGVVPRIMLDRAVRAINASLGEGMNVADLPVFRAQSYCPDVKLSPVITDLYTRTPAAALAESAIGPGKVLPVNGAQIALRFPTLQDPPPAPGCHLDGMYTPHNGVPKGSIANFTMLLGVALNEVRQPYSGNFTVWPGTHHQYERYFREHGPQALLNGMPPIALPEPEQLTAEAGDIFLCHYQLAHGAAPNTSPHIRYAVYFRLLHVAHEGHKVEVMTDIWREWEGMRPFLPGGR